MVVVAVAVVARLEAQVAAAAHLLVPRLEAQQEQALEHLAHTAVDIMVVAHPCLMPRVRERQRVWLLPLFWSVLALWPSCLVYGSIRFTRITLPHRSYLQNFLYISC